MDPLSEEFAGIGRLGEAVATADSVMADRVVGSSNSSGTIAPAQVRMSAFSHFGHRSTIWYHQRWLELHRVLGRVQSWRTQGCA